MRSAAAFMLLVVCASAAEFPLFVRLNGRLSSYSTHKGSIFEAEVMRDAALEGSIRIPAGSILKGRVLDARSIGIGLVRERAELNLDFFEYRLPDGRTFPVSAQVRAVDNAREQTTRDGRIRGILAAAGAPGLARGLWRLPSSAILSRPSERLTGFGLEFWPQMGFGPVASMGVFAFRWIALRFPEPEINLPRGTEMTLSVTALPHNAPAFGSDSIPEEPAGEWGSIGREVSRGRGKEVDDVINVILEGTRAQVVAAFDKAGWVSADPLTKITFMKLYHAWTSQKGYPTAPVSTLYYEDREPDLVFQKSLNTVNRRHHIRLWQVPGRDVWLAAGTHDSGVSFNVGLKLLTHKIDPAIDAERSKVLADLKWAGAVSQAVLLADTLPGKDKLGIVTDGRILKLKLQSTAPAIDADATEAKAKRPGTPVSRFVRRFSLETRQYILRDNYFYWGFRGVRAGTRSFLRRGRAN